MRERQIRQKGQAIVVVAAMMAVLLGFAGLAIDTARLLDARRVLQDSVDAAALATSESFQAGKGWSVAQANGVSLFEVDNRLSPGETCSPVFAAPAPGTPVTVNCTMAGGYTLAITAADNGPGGQSFSLSARRTVSAVLLQAVGQFNGLLVQAAVTATANDLALTPAVGALASNDCFGTPGIDPVQISGSTSITGDAVSNGSFAVANSSAPLLAGNVLTRCAPPTNAANIVYRCWRSGAAPPCPAGDTLGRLLSTNSRLADPRYSAPASVTGLLTTGQNQAVWTPNTYSTDPQFGSIGPRCYFLTPGVYEWQAGLTVNAGIVSNQLRPPGEAGSPLWNSNGANCAGGITLNQAASGSLSGYFGVVATSVRAEAGGYKRESAPSNCAAYNVTGPGKLTVQIKNVPGAQSYNLFVHPGGSDPITACTGSFTYFDNLALPLPPSTSGQDNTNLGTSVQGTYDGPSFPPAVGRNPPDSEVANSFNPSLPKQSAPRTPLSVSPIGGDFANENRCENSAGTPSYCPAAVTPGAVIMKVTGSGCINVKTSSPGGDLHVFSGYQYNWIVVHEPPTTTCTNAWSGQTNSAAIGLVYAPGAAFNLAGAPALTAPTGGIIAATVSVNGSTVVFDPAYSPLPPATRLNG